MTNEETMPVSEELQPAEESKFYEYRGILKQLKESLNFLTDHFWRTMRLSLPVAVPLALCFCAVLYVLTNVRIAASEGLWMPLLLGAVALTVVAYAAFEAMVYELLELRTEGVKVKEVTTKQLYGRRFVRKWLRAVVVDVLMLLAVSVLVLAVWWIFARLAEGFEELFYIITVGCLLGTALLALLVPLAQCLPHALLLPQNVLSAAVLGYKRGWEKWMRVFTLLVIVGVAVVVLSSLLLTPAAVISFVETNALLSELEGDAVDLPSGFSVAVPVILLCSALLYVGLVCWLQLLPQAFLFGSIKADADERAANELPMI